MTYVLHAKEIRDYLLSPEYNSFVLTTVQDNSVCTAHSPDGRERTCSGTVPFLKVEVATEPFDCVVPESTERGYEWRRFENDDYRALLVFWFHVEKIGVKRQFLTLFTLFTAIFTTIFWSKVKRKAIESNSHTIGTFSLIQT